MIDFYQNGELITSIAGGLGSLSTGSITIGKFSSTQPYGGYMRDMSIWNIARSQSQHQSDMAGNIVGNETGLMAYWKMDEGTGSTIADSTLNGNHGTLRGATWVEV